MLPVRRGLDFIVFGVPRSGTKGLVRALNLHPEVLCANEQFNLRTDHGRISFPEDFLGGRPLMHPQDSRKLRQLRSTVAEKPTIRHVGNKWPRYYLDLPKVDREARRLRKLLIYRSPRGFMPSWDRRELLHRESRWHAGEVGLFGFLDLITCLAAIAEANDVFLFPYELGLNQSIDPILEALAFIGVDPEAFDRRTFCSEHLPLKVESKKRLPLADYELRFLEDVQVDALDAIMENRSGPVDPALVSEIDAYLRSVKQVLPAAVDRAFRSCRNPAVRSFGAHYFSSNRDRVGRLLDLTAGSRAMSDFLNFGVRRRAEYAFHQRFLLAQRMPLQPRRNR